MSQSTSYVHQLESHSGFKTPVPDGWSRAAQDNLKTNLIYQYDGRLPEGDLLSIGIQDRHLTVVFPDRQLRQ
jgi:hypothetical protein